MEYRPDDLARLHTVLLEILKETIRVCEQLGIEYFIIGGTAVGALFHKGFVPWDDDIDLGMTRENYDRFIRESPGVLTKGFFLQCFNTEPDTPFYFAKIRKDNTLFLEKQYAGLNIHHGIFIDIFPFDNVPDNPLLQKVHRRIVQFREGLFRKSLLKEAVAESMRKFPRPLAKILTEIRFRVITSLNRSFYYRHLTKAMTAFNGKKCTCINLVKMPLDHIERSAVSPPAKMTFEGLTVNAPARVEQYLRHHYPYLSPTPPEEYRITHMPEVLSFDHQQYNK